MSKKSYFGVNGVARNVKSWPVGIGNVARKAKSGYFGVGGVARKFLGGVDPVLNNNDWATIRAVSDANQGENYWSIGDYKNIRMYGNIQGLWLTMTVRTFIIGFNHNSAKEGPNRIHFQIGKTTRGEDIAFCDSRYPSSVAAPGFRMNIENGTSGGWNDSYGRKTLLGNSGTPTSPPADSFMAAMPADLRAVMKSVTKYTDNTGNSSNTSGAVTATTDYLFFLAEFEVQGSRTYANKYEQNYQAQYDYYKAGNSKVKYRHNDTSENVYYWCRSARSDYNTYFCSVSANGAAYSSDSTHSRGLAPGFCV